VREAAAATRLSVARARRSVTVALTRAGATWRRRRLSLAGLPPDTRRLARLALATVALAGGALLIKASGFRMNLAPGLLQPTTIMLAGGLGIATAAIAAGAGQARRRWLGVGVVALGSLAGATLASLVIRAGLLQVDLYAALTHPADQLALAHSGGITIAAGWTGLLLAVLAIVAAAQRRRPVVVGALAGAPYLLAIGAYLIADSRLYNLGGALPAVADPASGRQIVAAAIASLTPIVQQGPLDALLMWQALEFSRWSVEVGHRGARLTLDPVRFLAVALVLKVGWLILGYGGRLPAAAAWDASRGDGLIAWVLAFAFAGVAGWWLVTRRRVIASEHGTDVGAGIVVVGFVFAAVVATILLEIGSVTALVVPAAFLPGAPLLAVVDWISERTGLFTLLSIPFAAFLALILWRRRRAPAIGLFLAIYVVWAGIRAVPLIPTLLDPAAEPSLANPTSVELISLDAAMTVVIALLFGLWLVGRQRATSPRDLLVVLLASTFMAYAAAVAGDSVGTFLGGAGIYLAALFPFAFRYLWNAGSLNARSSDRPARLLIILGLGAATLIIAATNLLADVPPATPGIEEVGGILLLVPALVTLLAATLGSNAPEHARTAGPEPA
jgi:hypothetical protein